MRTAICPIPSEDVMLNSELPVLLTPDSEGNIYRDDLNATDAKI